MMQTIKAIAGMIAAQCKIQELLLAVGKSTLTRDAFILLIFKPNDLMIIFLAN
jgi:hypothetical protein